MSSSLCATILVLPFPGDPQTCFGALPTHLAVLSPLATTPSPYYPMHASYPLKNYQKVTKPRVSQRPLLHETSYYLHHVHSVPGPVPSTSYTWAPLILTTTLCGEYCYYPHLADQETEAQRGQITCHGHTTGDSTRFESSLACAITHSACGLWVRHVPACWLGDIPKAQVPSFALKAASQPHSDPSFGSCRWHLGLCPALFENVDPKENPRLEGLQELRAGLPHRGQSSRQAV